MTAPHSTSLYRPSILNGSAILMVAAVPLLSGTNTIHPESTQRTARPAFQRPYDPTTIDPTTIAISMVDVPRITAQVIDAPYIGAWLGIRALSGLDDGWKGPGSRAVTQAAIDDAECFTLATITADIRSPDHIGAASDGELVITWRAPDAVIDISLHGEGTYSYYAIIAGQEYLGDDIHAATPLPAVLLAAIQRNDGAERV
ncbi:MAG: hypothetical protein ABL908_06010 [Hyphomicrobium sp.]